MAQFVAYVYPERDGYRVSIEALGDVFVPTLEEAEDAAFRIAARSVFASYPDRGTPSRPGAAGLIALELRIVPAPLTGTGPGTLPAGTGTAATRPRAPGTIDAQR